MLAHLQSLTWRFPTAERMVWAIAPYSEPVRQLDGSFIYRPRRASESGDEGWACVDDAARAALLAMSLAEADIGVLRGGASEASPARSALAWARRWMTLVRYMQGSDGRFVNFVSDATGTKNLDGVTSYPGGLWWTGRALWALARYHRITRSRWALESWLRCPLPDLGDTGKTLGLFTLAACELLRADPSALPAVFGQRLADAQARLRPLVTMWCEAIVGSGPRYFRDYPNRLDFPLWGYHQLHAVAAAAQILKRVDWIQPCVDTVRNLVEPVIAARGLFRWDPDGGHRKEGLCAYCVAPMVQGLAALYRVTGDKHHRMLACEGADWLYGRNDARAILYDPVTGRCVDGLDGRDATILSANYGAESSIEAGFMEVERQALYG